MNSLSDIYFTTERYFSNGGGRSRRNFGENEGIFADCGDSAPVPFFDRRTPLVWTWPSDEGSGTYSARVLYEVGL